MLPGQEVIHQPDEITGPLDLGPVTAPAEDMQLRPVDQVQQPERGVQRNHLVIAAVDDQRLLADLAQVAPGGVAVTDDAGPTDHFQISHLSQVGQDFVLHTVGEERILLFVAQILEG